LEKLDERLSSIAGDPGLIKLEDELSNPWLGCKVGLPSVPARTMPARTSAASHHRSHSAAVPSLIESCGRFARRSGLECVVPKIEGGVQAAAG
jgi:hypothetical protein